MLGSNPKGYLQDVAVIIGDKASLQSLWESISLFKGPVELSKWFSSDMHAQITADAYDLFVVMISSNSSHVLVRAPISFQSAEEIRAALHTTRLLGMLFNGSGSRALGLCGSRGTGSEGISWIVCSCDCQQCSIGFCI